MTSLASGRRSSSLLLTVFSALLLFAWGCDNRGGTPAARCTPSCSAVQMCCGSSAGNRCVDYFSDPANCGACGNVCGSGQTCVNRACTTPGTATDAGPGTGTDAAFNPGSCSPACGADFMCCGTSCVAREGGANATDPSFTNCGACGRACNSTVANHCGRFGTTTTCMCGTYQACDASRGETCGLGPTGQYQCLRNDVPESCGDSHTPCAPGETCEGGMCVCGTLGRPCPTGNACVSGACRDLTSDTNNCGAIGNACGVNEQCVSGRCQCPGAGRACEAPSSSGDSPIPIGGGTPTCSTSTIFECGGTSFPIPIPGLGGSCGEVCCPDSGGCVPADENNCGGCGVVCTGEETCGTSFDLGGGDFPIPIP